MALRGNYMHCTDGTRTHLLIGSIILRELRFELVIGLDAQLKRHAYPLSLKLSQLYQQNPVRKTGMSLNRNAHRSASERLHDGIRAPVNLEDGLLPRFTTARLR